jgi:phosphoribosyl-ATP pyrophosphohydrolase
MTIGRGTGALHGASVPTLVPDSDRSGASRAGFDGNGRRSGRSVDPNEIDRLHRALDEVTPENHPRTARLLASSTRKVAQKVFEEAGEVALEAVRHNARGVVRESADLLYNLVALWYRTDILPDDVWAEMRSRALELGIAEKLPKNREPDAFPGAPKRTGGADERDA